MSNSIIDQQRDNETFFWVQHSWLPGPVKRYNHETEFKHMQKRGGKLVYTDKSNVDLMNEVMKLLRPIGGPNKSNPFYWHE